MNASRAVDLPGLRVLALTTDLPYFPGKMGVDYFNLRHLARHHAVGLVSLVHPGYPPAGVRNIEAAVERAYLWPREADAGYLIVSDERAGELPRWLAAAPRAVRAWLLRRLLGIHQRPRDALQKLVALSLCAPHLLQAIREQRWDAYVLIQSSLQPWLDYLPTLGAKLVYFHDVRSDYLRRARPIPGERPIAERELRRILGQERDVAREVDVAAFVSERDLALARQLLEPAAECGVAPVPVDAEYFHPAPADWPAPAAAIVLFTGHLSHPPNVDAVLHFLDEIWPLVLSKVPKARFHAVGMLPAESLRAAIARAPSAELHENVADIRPYYWSSAVYVVPMRFGGGVRQKLFEAWTMGVPVVCTSMAVEGTVARDAMHCWIRDDPAAFAERVAAVLGGEPAARAVVPAAKALGASQAADVASPRFTGLVERAAQVRRRRPYKVLLDLRWMRIGAAGGIEQATYELLRAMAQVDRRNAFRLLAPRSACAEWEFPAGFQVAVHPSDAPDRMREAQTAFLVNRLARSLGEVPFLSPQMRSLREYRRLDFDMVHSVASFTNRDLSAFPSIVTINDLQHLTYPDFFGKEEWAEREMLYRASASEAEAIICISEFTRRDVHARYGVPLEKLTTVWLAPSREAWETLDGALCQRLLAGMGLEGRFLLYPAHGWPHKNHAALVQAFAAIRHELPRDVRLVLTGRPLAHDHPAALAMAEPGLEGRVVHLGYRSPLEMRALFQACHALVFPSLFEGFGIPVAEALIAGKPVACSNVTSLPEIAGDAALLFDPGDLRDMASALLRITMDEPLRGALRQAAMKRRSLFSARTAAVQTLGVYASVYDRLHGVGR